MWTLCINKDLRGEKLDTLLRDSWHGIHPPVGVDSNAQRGGSCGGHKPISDSKGVWNGISSEVLTGSSQAILPKALRKPA
jgi:hypothetical protein